ncbi:MAG TPA: hypothetical protein VOB72_03400 [Candidatus Dormibacteraeota bacterium]|nr:hypothetical protein [Candidatus Dormibacteraeota bacterium]
MTPTLAFDVLTWGAILVLFLGLAAVLREVRLLRGLVTRNPDGFVAAPPELSLGERFAGGGSRIVLAVDSGCPLCVAAVERAARRAPGALVLTHESPEVWERVAGPLRVVRDQESWRSISHLSTPVLMLTDGAGSVRKLVLPVREEEVDRVVGEWDRLVQEGVRDVAVVRADS